MTKETSPGGGSGGSAITPTHPAPTSSPWRPMETAPKDGTPVLVNFGPRVGVHRVAWEENVSGTTIWSVDDRKHGTYPLRGYVKADERGWMPLPEAEGLDAGRGTGARKASELQAPIRAEL